MGLKFTLCLVTELKAFCHEYSVPGKVVIDCYFSNPLEPLSVCVFDDGYPEYCSFPLVLYYGRFLGDNHTVEVTVVDVYGQTLNLTFYFIVEQRKLFMFIFTRLSIN